MLLLSGAAPAVAAPFPVGSWYGTGQPHDKSEMWLDHMLPDGNFRAQFRKCIKGKAWDQFETGRWTMKGDTFTIHVLTVNGRVNERKDTYQFLFHDRTKQRYRYLANGFVFSSTLVDSKFEMPSCEAIS